VTGRLVLAAGGRLLSVSANSVAAGKTAGTACSSLISLEGKCSSVRLDEARE
jgi:hypothetical protein